MCLCCGTCAETAADIQMPRIRAAMDSLRLGADAGSSATRPTVTQ
jgi:hypothetical protein